MASHPSQNSFHPSCLKPSKDEYCRTRELPALLKMWPAEVEDYSYPGTLRIAALLRKALRAVRLRARGRNWGYDLSRHMGLIEALKAERERLDMLGRGLPTGAFVRKPADVRDRETLHLPNKEKSAGHFSPGS